MKNPNVSVQPPAGRQLPENWIRDSGARKANAESDYLNRIENAWRNTGSNNPLQSARLTKDSRTDAMTRVSDSEDEEVWIDGKGQTVRIRKQ